MDSSSHTLSDDLDEVEFVDEQLQDEYKCPVCQEVYDDSTDGINKFALQHKCCGKHVCQECYNRIVNLTKPSCPSCRNPDFHASGDKYFQRLVNNAQVYCSNKSKGCDWFGELNDYRRKHMNICPKSAKKCDHCTEIVSFQSQQSHSLICTGALIDCPNMCQQVKVQRKYMQNHLENECLQGISNLSKGRPLLIPFVATITQFSNIINFNKSWSSPSFYSNEKGYKMILHVSIQKKGFLSLSVQMVKGEYDDALQWPVAATIDVEIYDWKNKKNFVGMLSLTGDAFCQQIRDESSNGIHNGKCEFISLNSLVQSEFLKFDSVSFILKGFHFHHLPILQLPLWMKDCVSSFAVIGCKELMNNEYEYYGPPFYTSSNGYKLCVKVCLAGRGKGKGSHISLFAHILPGKNDSNLSWPFHADLKVSILNWKSNVNHIEKIISFSNACDDHVISRAKNGTDLNSNGCGLEQFCQHAILKPQSAYLANMQFLKEDTLLVKVDSIIVYSSPPQPKAQIFDGKYTFPFEFVVSDFSKRQKHSAVYYTKPFYTDVDNGYKLQMTVCINEKSISCFVFLIKGESDNRLEWPFRADIEVQLVNNRDATKCLSKIISFTPDLPIASCSPVTESDHCAGCGLPEFVLISSLSPDYTHGDFLTFRILKINLYSNALVKKIPRWQGRQLTRNCLEFNITGFSLHKDLGTKFLSPPFYTHTNGYKMRLEVDFPSKSSGSYISLFARLLKGEHDSALEWPLTCNLLVELLNWKLDMSHQSHKIEFHERIPNAVNSQVSQGNIAPLCYGTNEFVSENELLKQASDVEYVQQDCLRLRIKKIAAYSKTDKIPYWQYRSPSNNFTITLGDFTERMEMNNCFFSSPFFAFPQGYKMCLKIFPNGSGDYKGSHVSLFVCLLQGEFDDFLQWPFEGDIVIDVINWKEDKGHFRKVISLNRDVPKSYRSKVDGYVEIPDGWGFSTFIPHINLLSSSQRQSSNAIYVEENKYVQFMVRTVINNKTSLLSKSPKWKGWLNNVRSVCEFTLTNYSKRKQYEIEYYSPDFYTHKNGYKMRIKVESNGSGNFKGTSLSLYACLSRGEFDDSLKWPMNVEVPIEIVNWKKNAFHVSKTVNFGEASLDCKSRVPSDRKLAESYWGFHNFCENSTLNQCTRDIQYIDEDCLYIRVKQPIIHSRKGIFS